MKTFAKVLGNLVMIGLTGGGWVIVIIFYLIWKSTSKKRNSARDTNIVEKTFTKFQGPGFAQESAKGAVFEYVNYKSGNEVEGPFAIIDFETNGLDKGKHRIIEVAVKRIHKNGDPIDEISTLINPEVADAGPTFIHHIKTEELVGAPKFKDFAPELLSRLSGSIVVAHHAAFEDGFLGAELARLSVGVKAMPCIDTLWLARQVIDLPNYKLATVLEAFGLQEEDAHTALGDVRLLAKLLPVLLSKSKVLKSNTEPFSYIGKKVPLSIKTRVSNLKKGEAGWLANMVRKLPESGQEITSEVAVRYTEFLSQILSDGKITGEEAKELSKIAGAAGLGAEQVRKIHSDYVLEIEKLALSDGKITTNEQKQLDLLKKQLLES
jgi:DNA polymerase-3 subunit epsilon